MSPEKRQLFLEIENLITGYGKKQILSGVTLTVGAGETVALIGHNGAGKSTLLKAAFGLLPVWSGRITFDGVASASINPRELLRKGIAYVPQGNRVFFGLTVLENLQLAGIMLPDGARFERGLERVLSLFPGLEPHLRQKAGSLSGGEKQMLALANALLLSPRLLLLDEPSLGLAPPLVLRALGRIRQISTETGTAILVVEQKVREVLKISHRVYVMRNGLISFSGLSESLRDEAKLREVYI